MDTSFNIASNTRPKTALSSRHSSVSKHRVNYLFRYSANDFDHKRRKYINDKRKIIWLQSHMRHLQSD